MLRSLQRDLILKKIRMAPTSDEDIETALNHLNLAIDEKPCFTYNQEKFLVLCMDEISEYLNKETDSSLSNTVEIMALSSFLCSQRKARALPMECDSNLNQALSQTEMQLLREKIEKFLHECSMKLNIEAFNLVTFGGLLYSILLL